MTAGVGGLLLALASMDVAHAADVVAWGPSRRANPAGHRHRQHHATTAIHRDGPVVVVWDEAGPVKSIKARVFGLDLSPVGDVVDVGRCINPEPCRPDVVATAGGFFVVWSNARGVSMRRIGVDGSLMGDPIVVVEAADGATPEAPDLAATPDGLMVAWTTSDRSGGDETSAYSVRAYDNRGMPLTEPSRFSAFSDMGGTLDIATVDSDHVLALYSTYDAGDGTVEAKVMSAELELDGMLVRERPVSVGSGMRLSRPMVDTREGLIATTYVAELGYEGPKQAYVQLLTTDGRVHPPVALGRSSGHPIVEIVGEAILVQWDQRVLPEGDKQVWEAWMDLDGLLLSDPGQSELAGVDAERPALDARWVNGRGVAVRVWTARPAPEADPQVYLQLGE